MIDKKISVSDQVSNLSIPAQLFYTWSIPHADDIGLLPRSIKTLKGTIVPLWEESMDTIAVLVAEILQQKLMEEFDYNGEKYYRIVNFSNYQTLKKDRNPQTILKVNLDKNPSVSWKLLEDIGFQMEDDGNHLDTEVKGTEEKRSEVKLREDIGPAPAKITKDFFAMGDSFQEIKMLLMTKMPEPLVVKELQKFCSYWTEPNTTGTKVRWQLQPTFDVKRRLRTWLENAGARSKKSESKYRVGAVNT